MSNQETITSIAQWAHETFGETSPKGIATRANEEMAELLRAVTTGAGPDSIIEEAADVAIVLMRLLAMDTKHGPYLRVPDLAMQANLAMADVVSVTMTGGDEESVMHACATLMATLELLVYRCGGELDNAINEKMSINRARTWKQDGSGHGYHVQAKELTEGGDRMKSREIREIELTSNNDDMIELRFGKEPDPFVCVKGCDEDGEYGCVLTADECAKLILELQAAHAWITEVPSE